VQEKTQLNQMTYFEAEIVANHFKIFTINPEVNYVVYTFCAFFFLF